MYTSNILNGIWQSDPQPHKQLYSINKILHCQTTLPLTLQCYFLNCFAFGSAGLLPLALLSFFSVFLFYQFSLVSGAVFFADFVSAFFS
ncbi:hypothetical protein [Duncaniella dubosii]|uniref:hypothetical protein n=1 Tax=Duncaniella dubosii TaxID=2518971 RepID=UPI003F6717C7